MADSIPDLRAQLEFRSTVVQSQAFTALVGHLRATTETVAKSSLSTLFFSCLTDYGCAVAEWTAAAVLKLIGEGIIQREQVLSECSIRLEKDANRPTLVRLLLTVTGEEQGERERLFSSLLRAHPSLAETLADELTRVDRQSSLAVFFSLLLSGVLPDRETELLIGHYGREKEGWRKIREAVRDIPLSCVSSVSDEREKARFVLDNAARFSSSELSSLSLSTDEAFEVAAVARERIELLSSASLPSHPVLLPSLLEQYMTMTELDKAGLADRERMGKMKSVLAACQQSRLSPGGPCLEGTSDASLAQWLAGQEGETLTDYISMWCEVEEKGETGEGESGVSLLSCLLPLLPLPTAERALALMARLAGRQPQMAPRCAVFLMSVYARPWEAGIRPAVLRAIGELGEGHRLVVPQVLKFLLAVCGGRAADRMVAIDCIGGLMWKFPTIFDQLASLLRVDEAADGVEWAGAKLALMETVCRATDRCESLLPHLSHLINTASPALLPAVLRVCRVLCEEEVLGVASMAGQLRTRVRQPGREKTLEGYCGLIALARRDEEEAEFAAVALSELWTLISTHSHAGVRASAAEALAEYPWTEVEEYLKSSLGEDIRPVEILLERVQREKEWTGMKGLSSLLHRCMSDDAESLPRPLYTRQLTRPADPLTEQVATLLPTSAVENEAGQIETIALFSPLLHQILPQRRANQAAKMFTQMMCQFPFSSPFPCSDDDWQGVEYLSAWNSAARALMDAHAATRTDQQQDQAYVWSREQCSECVRRALLQSHSALPNALAAITYMACYAVEKTPSDASLRPWVCSVVELLQLVANEAHKHKTTPIFQMHVAPSPASRALSLVLLRLLSVRIPSEHLAFFDDSIFDEEKASATLSGWMARVCFVSESEMGSAAGAMLDGRMDREQIGWCGRSRLWQLGAALCVSPTLLETWEEQIVYAGDSSDQAWAEKLEKESSESLLFSLCELDEMSQSRIRPRLKKKLEKEAKTVEGKARSSLLSSLALYHLSNERRSAERAPGDYSALPEHSPVRATVALIRSTSCPLLRRGLLSALCDVKRSDGRSLPPLDWLFLYGWIGDGEETHRLVTKMACQQSAVKLLTRLTQWCGSGSDGPSVLSLLSSHLASLIACLPVDVLRRIVTEILHNGDEDDWRAVDGEIGNATVSSCVRSALPPIDSARDSTRGLWKAVQSLRVDETSKGLSRVALECRSDVVNVRRLVEHAWSCGHEHRATGLLILLASSLGRAASQLIDRLLDTVTAARIAKANGTIREELPLLWGVWCVLVSAIASPIPSLAISGDDRQAWKAIEKRIAYHITHASREAEFVEAAPQFVSFICLLLNESSEDCESMKTALRCLVRVSPMAGEEVVKQEMCAALC